MALTAYIVVTLGTTDDFQILHYSPIALPLLNVGIDLKGFYALAPWLYVLIHAYLLLVFSLLTQKLHHFEACLAPLPYPDRVHLRKRLHVLALTQYVSGRQSGVLGIIISFMVWFTASVMPIALLLWMRLDFLPAQESSVVWGQRCALLLDCLVGWYFWHRIMQGRRRQLMPRDWSPSWWRRPTLGGWVLGANALMILWLGWFVALIPISPWERKLNSLFNEDCPSDISTIGWDEIRELLMDEDLEAPELSEWARTMMSTTEFKNGPRTCVFDSTHWLSDRFNAWFPRALSSTFGQAFSSGALGPRSKEALLGSQAGGKELDEIIGLDLSERSFRFANFAGSALPKATLRLAQFQGATLWEMNLQRSDMFLAQFHGADMSESQLQESLLTGAQMQGVDLSRAQLVGRRLVHGGRSQGRHVLRYGPGTRHVRRRKFRWCSIQGRRN